jgi:hypothetical protein
MLTQMIIRLFTPIIVEVIKELLAQLASGQAVQVDEQTVKSAMMAREPRIALAVHGMRMIPDEDPAT